VKVLLVDDSEAVRNSFGELLASVPNVELIGCAEDVAGALSLIETRAPDLLVLDVELRHGEHGMTVLQHVMRTRPGLQVVVLSNFTWNAMRNELLAAGAAAYFDKANEFLLARDWIASRAAVSPGLRAGP
jgi:DNA-binding NarL/FixJ family response regulator